MFFSIGNVGDCEMSGRENEIWDTPGHAEYLEKCWGEGSNAGGRHWELLKCIAELVRGETVLDAGCGMGHFYPVLMKEKPDVDYRGFDNSVEMLKRAQGFFGDEAHRFTIGDIYDLSQIPNADTVVCISVLLHLPEVAKPIEQLWSKADKELIISLRTDEKGFLHSRPYSGKTALPEGKNLIIRGERVENLFTYFGCLDDVGSIEVLFFDSRSSIFRLTRGIMKYGGFRHGWSRQSI